MSDGPIMYNESAFQQHFNMQPSEVAGTCNKGTQYYKRMLWAKLYSVFKFALPESWKENYFRYWLFHYGSIGVIYTHKFGWICQPYGIKELDLYYNPKIITVYNRFLSDMKVGVIGTNAGIIHLMDDFYGLDSLITKYAEELAQCDRSINVNLMNSNVTMMAQVESKKQAEEVKQAYEEATTGKPLVTINKDVMNGQGLEPIIPNISGNYIVDKLLTARRGIMNAFLTEIGIKNANMDKRERLNSQEVEENNDETRAIVSVIYDNLKKDIDALNKISGLGIGVELRYNYEGGADNGESNLMGLS